MPNEVKCPFCSCYTSPMCESATDARYYCNTCGLTFVPNEHEIIEANAQGGMNSAIPGRYDLLPPNAIEALAQVLEEGAKKYAEDNWKLVPTKDHINHALRHIHKFLGERSKTGIMTGVEALRIDRDMKEHITHAMCRLVMAVSQYLDGK